jgi:hypothetical protein
MDPIIILAIAIILLVVFLRIFFGLAKLFIKIAVVVVIAVVIWRVFFVGP